MDEYHQIRKRWLQLVTQRTAHYYANKLHMADDALLFTVVQILVTQVHIFIKQQL